MSGKKSYFIELFVIVICYFICFTFALLIVKGIPGYSEEAGGKRFVTAVGYTLCNVIVFIAVSLLRLPTKKKLITASCVVFAEAAISSAIYFMNARYYASVLTVD